MLPLLALAYFNIAYASKRYILYALYCRCAMFNTWFVKKKKKINMKLSAHIKNLCLGMCNTSRWWNDLIGWLPMTPKRGRSLTTVINMSCDKLLALFSLRSGEDGPSWSLVMFQAERWSHTYFVCCVSLSIKRTQYLGWQTLEKPS